MHDIHVADKIHKLILENAALNKLKNVKQVKIELGSIVEHGSDINPENLIFNLGMLAKGTLAENAEIEIKNVPGDTWRLVSLSGDELQ